VLCGGDIALILLDATIDDRVPLVVRATAAAKGDHLRTVGFDARQKLVRDHVAVTDITASELLLDEAPCADSPGGPAIDESTGELVGVLSRSDPSCTAQGARDVYTRVDTAMPFIDEALGFGQKESESDAAKEKKGPVDMGATCQQGADCAAGVCVTYASAEYCSRTCDGNDKCPADFKCMQSMQGPMACVES
jgi:secreted trypsin-like serine protease